MNKSTSDYIARQSLAGMTMMVTAVGTIVLGLWYGNNRFFGSSVSPPFAKLSVFPDSLEIEISKRLQLPTDHFTFPKAAISNLQRTKWSGQIAINHTQGIPPTNSQT